MSNSLKKHNELLEKLNQDETKELKLVKAAPGSSFLDLPEMPRENVQSIEAKSDLKSVKLSKTENHRLRREKDLLLDQLSKINIDIESKKNELECAKSSVQDKVDSKELVLGDLEKQELRYKYQIQLLSEQVNQLKFDLEDNERKLKKSKDESESKENELKSGFISIQNQIDNSEKTSDILIKKIDNQEKRLLGIGLLVDEKETTLADTNRNLKTLQQNFNSLKIKYDNLLKEHKKVHDLIEELGNYERDLLAQKELAQEKLNNEIERNKLRYDIERQTQFKNLNSQLALREQDWEKEHSKRNSKRENQFERLMEEKNLELNRKIEQTEKEVFEIHTKARAESITIRESSELILKEAYIERQRLLDEGSCEKMKAIKFVEEQVQASHLTAEKIRLEANEKLNEAQEYYKNSELESKKLLETSKSRAESILRKADIQKRTLVRNAQLENEQITKKLKNEEVDFLENIEHRKIRLNNYLAIKRNRVLKNIEDNNKVIKEKERKIRKMLLIENEKIKRKQLKKVVFLKDQVLKKANDSFEEERIKIKQLRKKELEGLYHERKAVLLEISELKDQSAKKNKSLEKEQKKYLAQKEKVEEKIFRERKEELEDEYKKNTASKFKELENFQKQNSERLKLQVSEYISSLLGNSEIELNEGKIKNEINSIFQNSFEHKKDKLLQGSGQNSSELKSKDFNSFFTKYIFKALIPLFIVGFFLFNGLGSRDLIVSLGETAFEAVKENSKSNEAQILKDELDKKTFSPVLTVGFKNSYVDNILYTKNFLSIYESDEFQNDWLLAAYSFISDELELNEEVAIKFISAEGTFIRELSVARDKIDARFLTAGINKMKQIENNAFESQISHFKTIENWKAFQAYRNNFFTGKFK